MFCATLPSLKSNLNLSITFLLLSFLYFFLCHYKTPILLKGCVINHDTSPLYSVVNLASLLPRFFALARLACLFFYAIRYVVDYHMTDSVFAHNHDTSDCENVPIVLV